jgi:hypothetical protein
VPSLLTGSCTEEVWRDGLPTYAYGGTAYLLMPVVPACFGDEEQTSNESPQTDEC